jgi:ribosomal protein L11 methylase PrmA
MKAMNINSYNIYLERMQKSYQDKLFFLDKINNIDGIIDFGCADGALLEHIHECLPNVSLVGYDIDDTMIDCAKHQHNFASFSSDFDDCFEYINADNSVLNLSSVLHEVYSYSSCEEIELFWNRVFEYNFKYIAIRDLCASESMNRPSNMNDVVKVLQKADKEQLRDYESFWGSIRENKNLVHYLMKYRYLENWNREVRENYFPLSLERLLSKIPTDKYEIVYFENYILPFTANKVKEDFGIELHDNTHVKLLLKRKD